MKNVFTFILILIFTMCLTGCNSKEQQSIIIKEESFLTQLNSILLNKDKYINYEITIEGIFFNDIVDGEVLNAIYRTSPGCCGNDGIAGLDVSWNGDIPVNNSWVKGTGILKKYEKDDKEYLILRLSSLQVLENRGKEFVTN